MSMIEAVLFDLDGVLVDACDWHYEALNKALQALGHACISRDAHLASFNGLPTHVKLEMLGIIGEEAKKINRLKQDFTLETIRSNAKIMEEKVKLHEFLKQQNIKIACVTNSIRETAEEMLRATGQLQYMDIVITNEDVSKNKPHPECYNRAIQLLDTNPLNVLCVEDSEKGIQAAVASVAKHLLVVKNTSEVNIDTITKSF